MAKQRIAYIDAMRGFTMILVVFAHVCHFCLGDSRMGYNSIFILFRLPCFFMLSGWLFAKYDFRHTGTVLYVSSEANYRGTVPCVTEIIKHKAMVQLLPTFIFLLLLAPPPEFFHQLGALKGGYWFTFVLFEFFILYILIERAGRIWSPILAVAITIASFFYARYYDSLRSSAVGYQSQILDVLGFLSVTAWRLFLFFYIGAWMRRHFEAFVRWTSKPAIFLLISIAFFLIASTSHKDNLLFEMLRYYIGGITGMWMVFTLFRLSASWLKRSGVGKPLQYVGTRTLDIYMLHYFFLPRFLLPYAPQLQVYDSRLLEFIVIIVISLMVVILCLITSYIIRLSPFLGHYLFGVNKKNSK